MSPVARSRLLWILAVLSILAGLLLAARYWLGGYAVRSVLRMAGASEIRIGRVSGTPGRLEIENLEFRVRTQPFAARRVTLERERWWMASLGNVRVEGARLPVVLDRSDIDPWNWTTYDQGGLGDEPVQPPFQSLDLDGELIVRMATVPDMPIAVTLQGRPTSGVSWIGSLVAEGTGFRLAGSGSLLRAGQELDFQVHSAELDLAVWAQHVQRLVSLPGGAWKLGGQLTGVAEGKVTAKRFAATARVNLRGGAMRVESRDIAATGAEAELEFSDLWKLRTKSGALRLGELRIGRLAFQDVTADFGLWDGKQLIVDRAAGLALGGRVETEPFRYHLDQRSVAVTVRPRNVNAGSLLSLAPGRLPRVAGRVGGELALRIHDSGVQIGSGHLALEPGVAAELQLNAPAVMRSGVRMDSAAEGVFKSAANQNVLIRLSELRLDIRPPGLPLGTSARAQVSGTVDGESVALIYHVNGAVERYFDLLGGRRAAR